MSLKVQLLKGNGYDSINQFNPATFLCMSQGKTWVSINICCGFCLFVQWFKVGGRRSFSGTCSFMQSISQWPVVLLHIYIGALSWSWSYGSWIYNYLCNQSLLPLTLRVRIPLMESWISIKHYVIKFRFVSGSLLISGFSPGTLVPPPIKLTATM